VVVVIYSPYLRRTGSTGDDAISTPFRRIFVTFLTRKGYSTVPLAATPNHAECARSLYTDPGLVKMYSRESDPAYPRDFYGTHIAPYLRHLLSYGHQTYRFRRPRGPLLNYGPVAGLRLSVWPLGGAKGFSFPLNISQVFKIFADISTLYCSTPQALQIPPCDAGIHTPICGSAPQQKIFGFFFTSLRN